MEGIYQNYMLYDFMLETNWHQGQLDIKHYLKKYIQSRYGVIDNQNIQEYIWNIADLVYSQQKVHKIPKNIIT